MPHWLNTLSDEDQQKVRRKRQPTVVHPMLATLTHEAFSGKKWMFERKLDGERCVASRKNMRVRLHSRSGKEITEYYPELVIALSRQKHQPFIVDGEIVAFEGSITSFSRLQPRMQSRTNGKDRSDMPQVYYYLFDILHLDGYNLENLPLRRRKRVLKEALSFRDPLRFTPHRNTTGTRFFREACAKGWEGVIAKKVESAYVHSRSSRWLKFKCVHQQEFVIGGFTEPQGSRSGFGALLIGYHAGDDLVFAGKVGTGFTEKELRRMRKRFETRERKTPPFADGAPSGKDTHWLTPDLVGEVGFTEWTDDGKLRHPRFLGLRDDKEPQEVVREGN